MQVERLHNGSVKIVLSEQELAARHLTFAELNSRHAATRQALQEWLEEAARRTGVALDGSLLIEAVPLLGGCLMLVTPESTRTRLRMRRIAGPFVYTLPNADRLLDLAHAWHRHPAHGRGITASSLYRTNEGYALIVYPSITFSKGTGRLLDTFCDTYTKGETAASFVQEHHTPMLIGNALPTLADAYSV